MTISHFQTTDGLFTIAPFDHRASLAQSLHLDLEDQKDKESFLHLKHLFMKILSPHVSAVLTDPDIGIATLSDKAPDCGLFLSLEESGYTGDHEAMTALKENWGIDGVKEHNAGAKLLVYYNPESRTAQQKLELVASLYEEACQKGVVFLVEPVLYQIPGQTQWEKEWDDAWKEVHLQVCEVFAPLCDILKIQYPGDASACARVSRMHPNWILLSRGAKYDDFVSYLRTAAGQGCRGFAAGRAVWQELTELPKEQWETFLKTTASQRLDELTMVLRDSIATH